ncbi:DUF6934 family protein [Puia dinghuensis]|uniref:Uncharacterized protein n=1 Tax=Puia dinghuensis TaxID=1792502 RepID=A0A8J2UHN7_9BACT|nr:hypothetical protein [Puia dinghuensis]GGB19580.1 hypothetical protein GCM10011511_49150 [Puia dinghuensis]
MKYEYYPAAYIADDLSIFEFISSGGQGNIRKQIWFQRTTVQNIYNLAFGDLDAKGRLDDAIISDNGDRNKILATIVRAVDLYTNRYPRRWIYFTGNAKGKTRLYRMAISLNLSELSAKFDIYCRVEGEREFVHFKKDLIVTGFLVKRRLPFARKSKIAGKNL